MLSDILECPVTFVVVKQVHAEIGDVQIGSAVVIVVTHSHAHAITFSAQTGILSYVFKGFASIVAVESIPIACIRLIGQLAFGLRVFEGRAIYKE